jgi:hypothetical protein
MLQLCNPLNVNRAKIASLKSQPTARAPNIEKLRTDDPELFHFYDSTISFPRSMPIWH